MTQVEFQYNGVRTIIPCKKDQKMEEICNNFINKSNLKESDIYYFYDGKGGKEFDKNLTFNEMANSFDKTRKKITILVNDNDIINKDNSKFKLKNIICPECKENVKMKLKNYEINLFGCINNHTTNNILYDEFEKSQMIDLTKIKCGVCKEKNKTSTFNNEFYKCYECSINLCPLCKTKHKKNHNIYNYDKINYLCLLHNEPFTNYCKYCKKDLCFMCDGHNGHEILSLGKMMKNKNQLMNKLEELKNSISTFNENVNKVIEVLNKAKEKINTYYKLEEIIFNNFDKNERNYELLYNINELISNNNTIINDIKSINNENNYTNKFRYIFNIYKYKNYSIPKEYVGQKMLNFSIFPNNNKSNDIRHKDLLYLSIDNLLDKYSNIYPIHMEIYSIINSIINIKKLNNYLIGKKDTILNSKLDLPFLKPYLMTILDLSRKNDESKRTYNLEFIKVKREDNNLSVDNFLQLMHKEILSLGNQKEENIYNDEYNIFDKVINVINKYFTEVTSQRPTRGIPGELSDLFSKSDIKSYANQNKSIISNLFCFTERICYICPKCHYFDSEINFRTSITFDLEKIILLKIINSHPKNLINIRDFKINKMTIDRRLNTLINLKEMFKYFLPELRLNIKEKNYSELDNAFKYMMMNDNNLMKCDMMLMNEKLNFLSYITNELFHRMMNKNNNLMMNNNFMMNKYIEMINNFMINNNFMMNSNFMMNNNFMMNSNLMMNDNFMMNKYIEMIKDFMMKEDMMNDPIIVDLKEAFQYYKFHRNSEKEEHCKKCNENNLLLNKIFTLPEYLLINIIQKTKINFLFPEKIDLTDEIQINLENHLYRLISVIKEFKYDEEEHYILFCYSQDKEKWYRFGKNNIRKSNFNEVLLDGEAKSLIYERIK